MYARHTEAVSLTLSMLGPTLEVKSDVCRRQILKSKVDPRA